MAVMWSMRKDRVLVMVLVLAMLGLVVACGDSGGGSADVVARDGGLPGDGVVQTDVPIPEGAITVVAGELDASDDAWIAAGAAWSRAASAATQMVSAVNGFVLLSVDNYGQSIRTERMEIAKKSLEILEGAGLDLEQAADDLLAGAIQAVAQAVSAPSGDAFALGSRQASIAQELRAMGTACIAEAARVGDVLDDVDETAVSDADLDAVVALLAQDPVVVVAAGPVLASAGTVTRAVVTPSMHGVLAAESAGNVGTTDGTDVTILSGWAESDGTAGPIPMVGAPAGVMLWRGDALAASPADRAVTVALTQPDALDGLLATLSFTHPVAAVVETRALEAGEACWRTGAGDDPACTLAESGLLPEGYYVNRDGGGAVVEVSGISQAVGRRIATGLAHYDIVVSVPEDTEAPMPAIDSLSPEEGPVGTTVTLQGRNFGNDPARVSVRFSCGRWAWVAPNAVSDTAVTATFPAVPWPKGTGSWCSYLPELYLNCGVDVQVGAHTAWGEYLKLTGLPMCSPTLLYPPDPEIASVGDLIALYGRGFSEVPEQNLAKFSGGVTAAAVQSDRNKWDPELTNVKFVIPEGAQTGEVRFKNTAGVDAWSQPSNLTVVPPTIPVLGPGEEAGGVHVPIVTFDSIGSDEPGVWGLPHSWILSHAQAGNLRYSAHGTSAGRLMLDIETRVGDFSVDAYVLDDTRLLVPSVSNGAGTLGRLAVGETISVRLRGVEMVNRFERVSAPLQLVVASKPEVGATYKLGSEFGEVPVSQGRLKVAVGDVVMLLPDDPDDVVSTGGLPGGTVTFRDVSEAFAQHATNAYVRGVRIPIDTEGAWTLTNTRTGASTIIEASAEGSYAYTSWPPVAIGRTDVAAEGAALACGGVRVDIPPGALPRHDEGGGYSIYCVREHFENLGLPELTAGGLKTTVLFSPEPPELLKPITLTMPVDAAGRPSTPELGLVDESTGLYATLPASLDGNVLTLVLPAGTYAEPVQASQSGPPAWHPIVELPWPLPKLPLNRMLGAMAAVSYGVSKGVLRDDVRQIQVNFVADPGASGYVTPDYAGEVLVAAQTAWDTLTGMGWPKPDGWLGGWIKLTITDMGPSSGTKGSTTKGVFGQPWVKINSQLASGKQLATTTAHEMGHVFQRQVTTVFSLKWIDEAAAGWAAYASLGSDADLSEDIIAGAEFPSVSLPSSFGSGYDVEQGYAAAVLAIWMEEESPGSVLKLYEKLRDSELAWIWAHDTLAEAVGMSVNSIVADFGRAYWSQSLDVVESLSISQSKLDWTGWEGVTVGDTRPKLSSKRFDVSTATPQTPVLAGRDVVVRATGLQSGQTAVIYRDTVNCGLPAPAMQQMKTLFHDGAEELLGSHDAGTRCYRVLVVNASQEEGAIHVRLVTPQVTSLSPSSGKNDGGYTISIGGTGFGTTQGGVYLSGFDLDVTSWSDTLIQATMFDAGTMLGDLDLKVLTAEQAWTNARPFTLVD